MAETEVNKLPYPTDEDDPDGPTQIGNLAKALDALKWGSRNLAPTMGLVSASEDLVLTTSFVDVPGASLNITPPVAYDLWLVAVFEFLIQPGQGWGSVKLDSETEEAAWAKFANDSGTDRGTCVEVYHLSLTAAEHTVKLRAKKASSPAGNATCYAAGTRFLYLATAA